MALSQVKEWGYEAVKFDALPIAIDFHEEFHLKMYDPTLTTKQAFRNAMKKARSILGKDTYLMSCSAVKDPDFLWAADIFDGGRVGNDIFEWADFVKEGVLRTLKFYPLHNMALYTDADNVILRDEYNNSEQAESRIYFVSLLGLPMTFGDNLPKLREERVELLRRCLPVMDIHPMDLFAPQRDGQMFLINLSVEKPYESYSVVDIFNSENHTVSKRISLDSDLHLDSGEYIVYDYSDKKFIGVADDCIITELLPYQSIIYCIRKKLDCPQIISTSRHITQGAAEICDMKWNEEELTLSLSCSLVEDDMYSVYLYLPKGYEIDGFDGFEKMEKSDETVYEFSVLPGKNQKYDFCIKFKKEA